MYSSDVILKILFTWKPLFTHTPGTKHAYSTRGPTRHQPGCFYKYMLYSIVRRSCAYSRRRGGGVVVGGGGDGFFVCVVVVGGGVVVVGGGGVVEVL